ncbi:hypothetical protein BJX99DRAFT_230590 [Aspergillus californicus]
METDIVQLYGPGLSFYRSQVKLSKRKTKAERSSTLRNYCAALRELNTSNQLLENKVKQLCSESLLLNFDVTRLRGQMHKFDAELLRKWQADALTRLVEVIYEKHGWKMPGGVLVGEHIDMDRDALTSLYSMAARKIKRETVTKKAFGLSGQYYLALQRYDEVVQLRSANPFRTECNFARWLASKKSTRPTMYRFWGKLFPVCYNRTIQESSEIF